MSLQTRLTALATAIGTDIKALANTVAAKSTWYASIGAPSAGLGQPGDWFMDQVTGKIYHKNPAWSLASMPPGTLTLDPIHVVGAAGEPAFGTNWLNYGAGFAPATFRKDPWGRVKLEGSVKGGASATTIFTLPIGYRPTATVRFNPRGSGQGNLSWGQINITTDGQVSAYGDNPPALISLDGVEFDTASVSELIVGSTPKQELPAIVTALPGAGTDGQIIRFQTAAMAALNVTPMVLCYRSTIADNYKWEVIGGGRMVALQSAPFVHKTASTSIFSAPGTGPALVIPVRGVYDVKVYGSLYKVDAAIGDTRIALGVDSTGQGILAWNSQTGPYEGGSVNGEVTGVVANAAQTLHLLIASNNLDISMGNPVPFRIIANPIRVG